MFHTISTCEVVDTHQLLITFTNGEKKLYDCHTLLQYSSLFAPLKEYNFFNSCVVDTGGYGIIWSDELDISSEELWHNGVSLSPTSSQE